MRFWKARQASRHFLKFNYVSKLPLSFIERTLFFTAKYLAIFSTLALYSIKNTWTRVIQNCFCMGSYQIIFFQGSDITFKVETKSHIGLSFLILQMSFMFYTFMTKKKYISFSTINTNNAGIHIQENIKFPFGTKNFKSFCFFKGEMKSP